VRCPGLRNLFFCFREVFQLRRSFPSTDEPPSKVSKHAQKHTLSQTIMKDPHWLPSDLQTQTSLSIQCNAFYIEPRSISLALPPSFSLLLPPTCRVTELPSGCFCSQLFSVCTCVCV